MGIGQYSSPPTPVAHTEISARVNPGQNRYVAGQDVHDDLVAHQFGHVHLAFDKGTIDARSGVLWVVDVFGADAENDLFAGVLSDKRRLCLPAVRRENVPVSTKTLPSLAVRVASKKFIAGAP